MLSTWPALLAPNRAGLSAVPAPGEAQRLASEARTRVAAADGPIDLGAVCSHVNAEVREAPLGSDNGGRQALLVPRPGNRFRIVLDAPPATSMHPSTARHRRRQRIAHELGHTLFYRAQGKGRPRRTARAGRPEEERFCDEFARALLVPVPAGGVTAQTVVSLQQTYDVSLEVAARAAASAADRPAVGLWWWRADDPAMTPLLPQWASSELLTSQLGIVGWRTSVASLGDLFARAQDQLGGRLTWKTLTKRRQVLAVLGTDS